MLLICVLFVLVVVCGWSWMFVMMLFLFAVLSFAAQTKNVFVQRPLDSSISEMFFVRGVYICLILCG